MPSKPRFCNEFLLTHSCGFLVTYPLDTHKGTIASMHYFLNNLEKILARWFTAHVQKKKKIKQLLWYAFA